MPIGANNPIVDKLIKKTAKVEEHHEREEKESTPPAPVQVPAPSASAGANAKANGIRARFGKENATSNTVKMTFYIKQDLLEKLYNYSYWERLSVTEAFNIALTDGLKDKNTKPVNKQ